MSSDRGIARDFLAPASGEVTARLIAFGVLVLITCVPGAGVGTKGAARSFNP
jgi:hypothetical protein